MTPSTTPMLTGDAGQLEAIQTVRFGVDGSAYEIDLTAQHASELRSMASRYISAARKIRPAPAHRRQRPHQPRPRTADKPAGRGSTARAAHDDPATTESVAAATADARDGEHGLTDTEKRELRAIADAAKPQRTLLAGRLRTKGLADRDTAGNWWLTDAGRRELISA